ncbi:MAG: UDP-N-acetylmuramate--L-alanine ligase [Snowella sp.]|jgi:UDP-N-acetylmuramate--alanine ligase|nr:MAG: UDP-N-acetylmuramate--L-alanine ligase [Snowella sp.]
MKTVDFEGIPFHFIGIGGIGMSALAYVLAKRQLPVSGSDVRPSHITERLQSVGVKIFNQQIASNLEIFQPVNGSVREKLAVGQGGIKPDNAPNHSVSERNDTNGKGDHPSERLPQVICSTAISHKNEEYQAALEKGCPIYHRSDVLASLIQDYYGIGVAGTHGKTTTSSLIGYVLLEAGLDPTIIVGGEVDAWDGNARLGLGKYLVAETDESDGSLTKHLPKIGIVTNIELDHPDHYQSLEQVVGIFQTFESNCETLIGCADCEVVMSALKPQITYSLHPEKQADYTVKNISYASGHSSVEVWERGQCLGTMQVSLPGDHNISNALAAVAVGRLLAVNFETIAAAIAGFGGAKRRFELKGVCNGITFIDDYAHHPSELLATLAAARQKVTHGVDKLTTSGEYTRIVAIFQPHRYSRTSIFLEEFATSFKDADLVILTDIYGAGETNTMNIQGEDLVKAVRKHHKNVIYQPSLVELTQFLGKTLQSGDLTLFLGAGNLNQIIPDVLANCSP